MYDENQPEPLTDPDTPNHTRFYGSDAPNGNRLDGTESLAGHYQRLANLNTGVFNGKWAVDESARWRQEDLAIFDCIAGQLELTPHQKQVGRTAYGDLDLRELSSPNGIDAALVAFITSAIVCRQDGRFYHPSRSSDTNDTLFVDLIENLDYRDSVVYSCYEKVLNRIDL
jgi:hypothetical protein